MSQLSIIEEIKKERLRQESKFVFQNRPEEDYLMILGEEVGEVNKAALEHKFCGANPDLYREEMIQVAAVALAAIECYDYRKNNP